MSTNDPYDSSDNPQTNFDRAYWGKALVEAKYVVLIKGTGKVDFDPATHKPEERRTGIDITIDLLADMGLTFPAVERNYLAESKLWAGTVLPTIKALGISMRELNGKYVKVSLKSTGRTFTGRDGSEKEETTILFEKLFADEEACRQDYFFGKGEETPVAAEPAATPASIPVNEKEKETARKFLKVLVENAARGQDDILVVQAKVGQGIAMMPLVNKYFTDGSSEVLAEIMVKMAK